MKFNSVKLSNFGPIKSGEIGNEKITVFFGHNNSGKSVALRLLHALYSFDSNRKKQLYNLINKTTKVSAETISLTDIVQSTEIPFSRIKFNGAKSGHISISNKADTVKIKLVLPKRRGELHPYNILRNNDMIKSSVYIPASRTGTVQAFANIVKMRNHQLNNMMSTLSVLNADEHSDSSEYGEALLNSVGKLPAPTNTLHEMILNTHVEQILDETQTLFKDMFGGDIYLQSSSFMTTLIFQDKNGIKTRIEDAGSSVLSSFPVMLGISHVKNGGHLIVEEPETGLDPLNQLKLVDQLVDVQKQRKINLHFATHDDRIIGKLLSFVSQKKIKSSDIGLYYFNRTENGTVITKMPVDKDGTAEQPIFDHAMDSLVASFSV